MSILTLIRFADLAVTAYENDDGPRSMQNGPHRTINGLALKRLLTLNESDPVFKHYEFKKLRQIRGEGVVQPGWLHSDTYYKAGPREGNYIWWIKEGGYTADEPELYASFRHFYDPKAVSGHTYLTDHLESIDWHYQLISNKLSKKALGQTFYPQVDAMEWAISGPEKEGFGRNEYCWERGLEAMRRAFAATDPVEKDRLFVHAWRALGETMHLIADMTSPAHVRNDSHPGVALGIGGFGETNPNEGLLKADPYDSYTSHNLVARFAGGPVDADFESQLDATEDPQDLFAVIATFTQDNFFTPDTLSGADRFGRGVTNANGQKAHPSPKLSPRDFDERTGYYVKTINDKPVRVAHESWLLSTGWGAPMHALRMTYPCVQDQASVLIPIAVRAGMKLADWYIPKIKVELESFDPVKGILKGRVKHQNARSAYPSPLAFNSADPSQFHLYLDGGLQNWEKIKLEVRDGEITADLSRINIPEKGTLALVLDVGGMRIRSEEMKLGEESVIAHLKKKNSVHFRLTGIFDHNRGGTEQRNDVYQFIRNTPEVQSWEWSGNSLEISWRKTYAGYGGVWEGATRTMRLSCGFSSDGKTLTSSTLRIETSFKDGPQTFYTVVSGLDGRILMPEPTRPYFSATYTGSGSNISTSVMTTRTGSVLTELKLNSRAGAPKVEVEF